MKLDRTALARVAALRMQAPSGATALQQGDRRSPFLGRGVEFADYRAYDPGDDVRLIDWNVYLRLGQALVRQFNEERSLSVRVCLDVSASMDDGEPRKADRAAQLAAALSTVALRHRDPVDLCCFGGDGPGARIKAVNLEGLAEVLHALERLEPAGHGEVDRQLAALLTGGRSDRTILLTDFMAEDDERERLLRLVAATSHRPIAIHVVAAHELEPDLDALGHVLDAETGQTLMIRDDAAAAEAYQQAVAAWLASITQRCRALGIQYIALDPSDDVNAWIEGSLHRGRVVEHAAGGPS